MRVRIHYTLPDGSTDSIVIEGDTVGAIREKAVREVERRGGSDPWSEVLNAA